MAFKGHITLDGKEYVLANNKPTKTLVNQMAPPIGQGESKYQDGTSWAAWIQKDWQDGNGKLDPVETGGFLYGEVDARPPRHMLLPAKLGVSDQRKNSETPYRYFPPSVQGMFTISDDVITPYKQAIRWTITTPSSWNDKTIVEFWFYGRLPSREFEFTTSGITCSAQLLVFTNSGGSPVDYPGGYIEHAPLYPAYTSNTSGSFGNVYPYFGWYKAPISVLGLSTSTTYHLVLMNTAGFDHAFDIAYGNSGGLGTESVAYSYNGTTWAAETGKYVMYFSNVDNLSQNTGTNRQWGAGFFRFDGALYAYSEAAIFKWDGTEWDFVNYMGTIAEEERDIISATPFDTTTFFATTSSNYISMSDSEVITIGAEIGQAFASHQGRIYRAQGNEIEYSSDGLIWEPTFSYGEPITVGPPELNITGMAGYGEELYASNEEGLYRITPGDFAIPVTPWGSVNPTNGFEMVNFQGALYIVAGGRVLRFTQDQRIQDVWMTKEDDVLSARLGRVYSLCAMNNWLVALVGPTSVSDGGVGIPTAGSTVGAYPTVWAMQGNAWFQLATLPLAAAGGTTLYKDYDVFYDNATQRLWVMTPDHLPYFLYVPNYTINPSNDPNYTFAYSAWVEWDWFDSNILEVFKDYEEVAIIGENLSASAYVEVFWMDDDSTVWEYLDTADEDISKLRWDITRTDRPATRRFKLGLNFVSKNSSVSMHVRAIRVKYLPMLRDWYAWNLNIDVAGTAAYYQEGIDREVNTRTATQIHDDLEDLVKATGIFLYKDIDGQQYEVKIKSGNFAYTKFEYNTNTSAKEWEGQWNIVVEQTHTDPYVP